jgi:peptidyl-prolyl cis-trans isomerase B (cyclophilin B)
MPSSRRTRDRQLAKLAARRAAERRRRRRQRILAGIVGAAVAVGGIGFAAAALIGGNAPEPAASPSVTPSASPSPTGPRAVACGGAVPKANAAKKPQFEKPPKMTIDPSKTYTATMKTSCGTIVIRLDARKAPNTVNSLVFLARKKFFDGLLFHRTVEGFVIQGGDPLTAAGNDPTTFGTGGPGYQTVDVPPEGSTYPAGALAMAKAGPDPAGTAGSQFFIVTGDDADMSLAPGGDPQYAIVGEVVKGLDIARMIEKLPRDGGVTDGRPVEDVYIVKVTIKVS